MLSMFVLYSIEIPDLIDNFIGGLIFMIAYLAFISFLGRTRFKFKNFLHLALLMTFLNLLFVYLAKESLDYPEINTFSVFLLKR
jgi:hypothetical protein